MKMYKAGLTCGQHQPEITEPTEIRKLFESWGGGADVEKSENVETRNTEARNTESRNAHEPAEMAKTENEPNREPQLHPFAGTSDNTGGTSLVGMHPSGLGVN